MPHYFSTHGRTAGAFLPFGLARMNSATASRLLAAPSMAAAAQDNTERDFAAATATSRIRRKTRGHLPRGARSMSQTKESHQYKLVLLGESGVGKSNLVLQFVKGQFAEGKESTIGGTRRA